MILPLHLVKFQTLPVHITLLHCLFSKLLWFPALGLFKSSVSEPSKNDLLKSSLIPDLTCGLWGLFHWVFCVSQLWGLLLAVFFCFVLILFLKFKFIYFIYLFLATLGRRCCARLSLVAVSGGYSLLPCTRFSLRWLLLLRSSGSRHAGFSSCGARA